MKIKAKIMAISETSQGLRKNGVAWRRREVVLAFGEQFEEKVVVSVWDDLLDIVEKYNTLERPVLEVELGFYLRDSQNFSGRKWNEISCKQIDYPKPAEVESF